MLECPCQSILQNCQRTPSNLFYILFPFFRLLRWCTNDITVWDLQEICVPMGINTSTGHPIRSVVKFNANQSRQSQIHDADQQICTIHQSSGTVFTESECRRNSLLRNQSKAVVQRTSFLSVRDNSLQNVEWIF